MKTELDKMIETAAAAIERLDKRLAAIEARAGVARGESALAAYHHAHAVLMGEIDLLLQRAGDMPCGEDEDGNPKIHWGHVGDINRAIEQLREIAI